MGNLTEEQIIEEQKRYGYTELQESINSGQCWLMKGSENVEYYED